MLLHYNADNTSITAIMVNGYIVKYNENMYCEPLNVFALIINNHNSNDY